MSLLSKLQPGVHLYDRRTGHERLVQAVEPYDQVVFLSFKHPQTGAVDPKVPGTSNIAHR